MELKDKVALVVGGAGGIGLGIAQVLAAEGCARLEPRLPGLDGAVGRLLGIVYTAMVDGTWYRLKACQSETCRWVFYDRSRNRSAAWCSMAVCGNREKARTYRRRRRGAEG